MQHRVAVIGTGFIGPVHVEALRRIGIEVVGVLGSSAQRSLEAAKKFRIDRGYQDLDELVGDEAVTSVHITSPNKFHFVQAAKCLQAGKHVLCEKPLAMNSDESRELVALAAESQVAAGVNYNIRYYPLCLEAAERCQSGQLGSVYHVSGSYAQDWLLYESDFNWRVLADEGGALRAVSDIGTHWLDLICSITGLAVESVCADLQTVHPTRERPLGGVETFSGKIGETRNAERVSIDTEDIGSVLIRFQGGARGILWVSQVTAGRKNCVRWEIAGAKQALAWNSEQPNDLWIGHRDRPNEALGRDPAMLQGRARQFASYPGGHNEGFPDTFKQLFTDFYNSVDDATYRISPTYPTFADGHREILLCEAIMASAKESRWISVAG